MKNTIRFGAIAAASALVLAACASAPEDEPTSSETAGGTATEAPVETVDYKACMVSDQGGFDDASFNESAYDGLVRASEELGIETAEAESTAESDYGPNLQAQVDEGCDLIITVGFLLGDATSEAAAANPDVNFAIVDFGYEEPIENVKPLFFETDEAAFLAGYAAASASGTGTLGTFGGVNIPTVSIFMDGFLAGANHFNEETGGDVSVLGWDGAEGSFVGNFEDAPAGQNITQGFLDQGADIVMPVAGPVGLGAASAIQSAGDAWMIGVDSDWTESAPEYADIMFTSVLKQISNAVYDTIEASIDGFTNEPYVGTLENEGVGIADFAEGTVDDETLAAIEEIRAGIIAGEIEPSTAG
ncbi:BMP family lipoprotein [Demequina muriae]|uniref:BMP family ABC transporter substrate-binding protein n=1 Tax=Demequina muriae TaxID=3051664 RepID=A0ABT8GEW5_9MICO|nr:BMP family ABC transporter substrate-binding protein [Demequina sp. EGI L300058]MDN4479970.1 BMP family ABC transporter substrate-binding protein [Demequina sp. EGI L300058]